MRQVISGRLADTPKLKYVETQAGTKGERNRYNPVCL